MSPVSYRFSPPLRVLTGAVLLVTLTGLSSVALAHNVVEDRIPVPESTITDSPVEISISVDDVFLDVGDHTRGFSIVLIDDAGLYYGDGCVELVERRMSAQVNLGQPGTYSVVYQFVSADGHSLSESYFVEFEPTADHTPSPGKPGAPACGGENTTPETLSGTPPLAGDDAPETSSGNPTRASPIPLWAWLGGPIVLLSAGALWWIRARSKRDGS